MLDPRPIEIPRLLAHLPLFGDCDAQALQRLATGCELRRFERGETVFRLGDPCPAFFVVVTGQVKLFVLSPDGHEKVIELVAPGHSFAEALMFLGRPCLVNAQALADSLLLAVGRQAVLDEIGRDPAFAMRMLAGLSRRLHGLVHDVQAVALQSGMQRVIGYLLNDRDADPADPGPARRSFTVTLPVAKATVASRLSLTPEYFSRVLRELEDAGLVVVDRRDIRIVDAERLAAHHG